MCSSSLHVTLVRETGLQFSTRWESPFLKTDVTFALLQCAGTVSEDDVWNVVGSTGFVNVDVVNSCSTPFMVTFRCCIGLLAFLVASGFEVFCLTDLKAFHRVRSSGQIFFIFFAGTLQSMLSKKMK